MMTHKRRRLVTVLWAVGVAVALISGVVWAQGLAKALHQEQQGPENPAHAVGQCADCHTAGERLPTKGAVMEAILNATEAYLKADKQALGKRLALPMMIVTAQEGGAQADQITRQMFDEIQPPGPVSDAAAVKMSAIRVELLAYNVALASFDLERGAVPTGLSPGRWAVFLAREAGEWKMAAVAIGPTEAGEPDEDARATLEAMVRDQIGAFVTGEQEKYLTTYADEVVSVSPDWGARAVGEQELRGAYQGLAELIVQGGIARVEPGDLRISLLGPNAAIVEFDARGLDDGGMRIGHRNQAYFLVRDEGPWRIVAEAVGMPEEG